MVRFNFFFETHRDMFSGGEEPSRKLTHRDVQSMVLLRSFAAGQGWKDARSRANLFLITGFCGEKAVSRGRKPGGVA